MSHKGVSGHTEPISNLGKKRVAAGLSQTALANASDVPLRTIRAYETLERDINKCQVRMALQLSKALGCDVEEILEDVKTEGA